MVGITRKVNLTLDWNADKVAKSLEKIIATTSSTNSPTQQ